MGQCLVWVVAGDHHERHEDEDEDDVCVFPSVSFWVGGCLYDGDCVCVCGCWSAVAKSIFDRMVFVMKSRTLLHGVHMVGVGAEGPSREGSHPEVACE